MKVAEVRICCLGSDVDNKSGDCAVSAHLVQRLAEAGLLYVTTTQTRGQLMARLLSADWSAQPEVVLAVIWAIKGQTTGHEWQACLTCQECQLAPIGRHRCVMTPGCKGSLQRLAKRPILTQRLRQILRSGANVNR